MPEYEYSGRSSRDSYYVVSVDVGRKGCDSVATIFKNTPQTAGPSIKSLVNIETKGDTHFEDQAVWLKQLYYKYKARRLVVDGNGIGHGLVDYLVKPQTLPTGEQLPDFGVYNDKDNEYKRFKSPFCEHDALFIIKANAASNTEMHANAKVQIDTGKVKFLRSERDAKVSLEGTKLGQAMSPEERAEYLKPYVLTSILREELMNLREENEGINIQLKQANRKIRKDKFSALIIKIRR